MYSSSWTYLNKASIIRDCQWLRNTLSNLQAQTETVKFKTKIYLQDHDIKPQDQGEKTNLEDQDQGESKIMNYKAKTKAVKICFEIVLRQDNDSMHQMTSDHIVLLANQQQPH